MSRCYAYWSREVGQTVFEHAQNVKCGCFHAPFLNHMLTVPHHQDSRWVKITRGHTPSQHGGHTHLSCLPQLKETQCIK